MGKIIKIPSAIALDIDKQKTFTKAVKKLNKKGVTSPTKNAEDNAYLERGLIYINHIPPGFFEKELWGYFSQFGEVTNVRVLRSHKTGRSKGAAFVEFLEPGVAKIAAETMDNYLMFKRRLEAKYIEPQDRHKSLFNIKVGERNYPKKKRQVLHRNIKNTVLSDEEHNKRMMKKMKKLKKNGQLAFCQIVNAIPAVTKGFKINQLLAKVKEEKKEERTKKKQQLVKTDAKEKLDKSNIADDSKKKKPKSIANDIVEKMAVKDVKKSLRTIKKTKDKMATSKVVLKPELIQKMSTRSKGLPDGERKVKTNLTLDPALVTEVNFPGQKGQKAKKSTGSALKKRTAKKS